MYKMLTLSLKELKLFGKNRKISGYESLPKDKLLRITNDNDNNDNDNKGDRKSLIKSKKE